MKNILLTLTLVLVVLLTVGAQQPQTQWEYKFDSKCNEKRANELAADGWELFSMSMGTWGNISTPTCVFKRTR